jgi:hypothetical protein
MSFDWIGRLCCWRRYSPDRQATSPYNCLVPLRRLRRFALRDMPALRAGTSALAKLTLEGRTAQLNFAVSAFFGLNWVDRSATCYVCDMCGHVLWFMSEP